MEELELYRLSKLSNLQPQWNHWCKMVKGRQQRFCYFFKTKNIAN